MEELATSVEHSAESAVLASETAATTVTFAKRGGEAVNDLADSMQKIADHALRISAITNAVEEIAFQTNLLALNAAVEAARAGPSGRGFAVVAAEVRSLAGRAADAAREIKTLAQRSRQSIDQGRQKTREATEAVEDILSSTDKVAQIIGALSSTAREQAASIMSVKDAVIRIDHSTQQNATLVLQASSASQSLEAHARMLDTAVAAFSY